MPALQNMYDVIIYAQVNDEHIYKEKTNTKKYYNGSTIPNFKLYHGAIEANTSRH